MRRRELLDEARRVITDTGELYFAAELQRVSGELSSEALADLEFWLRLQLQRLPCRSEIGKAIAYTTKRWRRSPAS